MNVFFDNCTAPVLASTLNGFISHYGHSAIHICNMAALPKGRSSTDLEWIEHLRSDPNPWMFISADARVLRNPAERAALRSAGLHGFITAKGFQKMPMELRAAVILRRWPDMLKITDILSAPTMHEIPVTSPKLKSLPL